MTKTAQQAGLVESADTADLRREPEHSEVITHLVGQNPLAVSSTSSNLVSRTICRSGGTAYTQVSKTCG